MEKDLNTPAWVEDTSAMPQSLRVSKDAAKVSIPIIDEDLSIRISVSTYDALLIGCNMLNIVKHIIAQSDSIGSTFTLELLRTLLKIKEGDE